MAVVIAFQDLEIGRDTLEQLRDVAQDVFEAEEAKIAGRALRVAAAARKAAHHWDFIAPARLVDEFLLNLEPSAGRDPAAKSRLRRVLVARLVLGFFEVRKKLPDCVAALIPDSVRRLAGFVSRARTYPNDYFAKDVRYALGQTLHCRAMQIDLRPAWGRNCCCVT
jgi:hypothetical protein